MITPTEIAAMLSALGVATNSAAKLLGTLQPYLEHRLIVLNAAAKAKARLLLTGAKLEAVEKQQEALQRMELREIDHRKRLTELLGDADGEALRATARLEYQERTRQRNLEAIAGEAMNELPESVSPEPVDPDWVAQFITAAQDVSNSDMQRLWGKILAGEVAKPSSFSRRTLSTVAVLSARDAQLFTHLAGRLWQVGRHHVFHICDVGMGGEYACLQNHPVAMDGVLTHLASIGLFNDVPMLLWLLTHLDGGCAVVQQRAPGISGSAGEQRPQCAPGAPPLILRYAGTAAQPDQSGILQPGVTGPLAYCVTFDFEVHDQMTKVFSGFSVPEVARELYPISGPTLDTYYIDRCLKEFGRQGMILTPIDPGSA